MVTYVSRMSQILGSIPAPSLAAAAARLGIPQPISDNALDQLTNDLKALANQGLTGEDLYKAEIELLNCLIDNTEEEVKMDLLQLRGDLKTKRSAERLANLRYSDLISPEEQQRMQELIQWVRAEADARRRLVRFIGQAIQFATTLGRAFLKVL